MRGLVQVTYEPALFFFDSYTYLEQANHPAVGSRRPLGYSILFLRPLLLFEELKLIPLVQHLLGLGMAVTIYAVLIHRGVRPWLSALATAPVLLDGYQLEIEQTVASDSFFQALTVAALALLIWRPHPSRPALALAGLLVGAGVTVRSIGALLIVVTIVYAASVGRGWRRVLDAGIIAATAALPLAVYSIWTYQQIGEFQAGSDKTLNKILYARAAPVADCNELTVNDAPSYIVDLCPKAPPTQRPQGAKFYLNPSHHGPAFTANYPPGVDPYAAQREFGMRVIRNQPLDIAGAVIHDFLRGFALQRTHERGEWPLETWRFDSREKEIPPQFRTLLLAYDVESLDVNKKAGAFLRDYQSVVYTRGVIFGTGIVIPLLAATRLLGARPSRLCAPALLLAAAATACLFATALFVFSWRYQLPAIPLLPWAAVMGLAALFSGLERARSQ